MANLFSSVLVSKPKTSKFNFTHPNFTSTSFGKLIPFEAIDVVPGDKFRIGTELFVQFAPFLAPIMSEVEARVDYFFVPNRLLWKDWEDFITRGKDGMTEIVPPHINWNDWMNLLAAKAAQHQITPSNAYRKLSDTDGEGLNLKGTDPKAWYAWNCFKRGGLLDHLGMPIPVAAELDPNVWSFPRMDSIHQNVDLLPVFAYCKLFSDWYKDQNVDNYEFDIDEVPSVIEPSLDGANLLYYYTVMRFRCWEKDYFTGALPFVQRGPELSIPLGAGLEDVDVTTTITTNPNSSIPVTNVETHYNVPTGAEDEDQVNLKLNNGDPTKGHLYPYDSPSSLSLTHSHQIPRSNIANALKAESTGSVDLSDIDTFTINDLRRYNAIQQWFEDNARAGARYVEQILSHFGVRVPDYRLDRAEYLGGSTAPLVVSTTFQQSQTTATSPLGERAGVGAIAGFHKSKKFRCEEHGWIIPILSIRPRTMYFQGMPKKFQRMSAFDYYWKRFDHLGEQEVLKQELDSYHTIPQGEETFGYVPRYAEYKYMGGVVTGDMRSSLDFWHLARKFSSLPVLSKDFISMEKSVDSNNRIFAVEDPQRDNIWVNMRVHIRAKRPMSKYSTPLM